MAPTLQPDQLRMLLSSRDRVLPVDLTIPNNFGRTNLVEACKRLVKSRSQTDTIAEACRVIRLNTTLEEQLEFWSEIKLSETSARWLIVASLLLYFDQVPLEVIEETLEVEGGFSFAASEGRFDVYATRPETWHALIGESMKQRLVVFGGITGRNRSATEENLFSVMCLFSFYSLRSFLRGHDNVSMATAIRTFADFSGGVSAASVGMGSDGSSLIDQTVKDLSVAHALSEMAALLNHPVERWRTDHKLWIELLERARAEWGDQKGLVKLAIQSVCELRPADLDEVPLFDDAVSLYDRVAVAFSRRNSVTYWKKYIRSDAMATSFDEYLALMCLVNFAEIDILMRHAKLCSSICDTIDPFSLDHILLTFREVDPFYGRGRSV